DRRCRESLNGPVAERPPRSGQHDSTNLRRRMSGNALENRAVLAVDRDDFAKPLSARVSYQITRDNESLLVGERDTLSSLQRSKRGVQSRRTDEPRRAQNRNPFWCGSAHHRGTGISNQPSSRNAIGITNSRLSNRSRIPPCPGIMRELSFNPASRFSKDSARSPVCAATLT